MCEEIFTTRFVLPRSRYGTLHLFLPALVFASMSMLTPSSPGSSMLGSVPKKVGNQYSQCLNYVNVSSSSVST